MIRTVTNKSMSEDHENKHGTRAQNGWYRYDVRFGIPVYDQNEDLERYNIYTAKMLVRHDADGKLYLYDIIRTKKNEHPVWTALSQSHGHKTRFIWL